MKLKKLFEDISSKERYNQEVNTLMSLQKHYNYDNEDRTKLKSYVLNSHPYNNELWNGKTNNKIEGLKQTIQKHVTPHSFTVWSKSIHNPEEIKDKNNIVHYPAFISTSIYKTTADDYLKNRNIINKDGKQHHHLYEIHVPKNIHGAFVHDKDSINPKYKEFILPAGLNLKHLHSSKIEDKNNIYHHHKLEVYND